LLKKKNKIVKLRQGIKKEKMKIVIYCLIMVSLGCQTKPKSLSDYPDITNIFEAYEIDDLEKIIDSFNKSICKSENLKGTDVLECYEHYFTRMQKAVETGRLEFQLPYAEQEKLMKELDIRSFYEVWGNLRTWKRGSDTLKVVNNKYNGKYIKFLKSFSKENIKIQKYVFSYENIGDISPTMIADIVTNFNEYDIRDERIKLLIAIHYLTLNERNKIHEILNSANNKG